MKNAKWVQRRVAWNEGSILQARVENGGETGRADGGRGKWKMENEKWEARREITQLRGLRGVSGG